MPVVKNYSHRGGSHWESCNLRNLLAHHRLEAPHNGAPLSEALLFLIANGIAAGYNFYPSVPGYGLGSGAAIVGRHGIAKTSAGNYADAFKRLGVAVEISETSGAKAAHRDLLAPLEVNKPVLIWTSPMRLIHLNWASNCGMFSAVVSGVEGAVASIGDYGATPRPIAVDDIIWARGRVCSHRNRSLTISALSRLTKGMLAEALREGLRACARDMLNPGLKTHNLPGLLDLSKMLTSTSRRGWQTVYPEGALYAALRDLYDSIETAGTGGGLYRPLFATGLEEAEPLLRKPTLGHLATAWRALGARWKLLADTALTDEWPLFRQTKELLRLREVRYREKGAAALADIETATRQLQRLDREARLVFPLTEYEREEFLEQLAQELRALHDEELNLAEHLQQALA